MKRFFLLFLMLFISVYGYGYAQTYNQPVTVPVYFGDIDTLNDFSAARRITRSVE